MSNTADQIEQPCDVAAASDAVVLMIQPRETDLGGFSVRRVLPNRERRMVGPWIFFDHMGPADFAAGQGVDVRPHPHIGLATVTYLFEGEMLHRDSLGNEQAIVPGDINLMVAGKGIVHSERERPAVTATPHRAHGLQLWLALPEADEEIEPAFYHYSDADIPRVEVDGAAARVLMGSAFGVTSPVKTYAYTLYVEVHLRAGQRIVVPQAAERAVYVAEGVLRIAGTAVPEHSMAVLGDAPDMQLEAQGAARIGIIGGEALDKRYIEWNFVSSRAERIAQAKADWLAGRFPTVPGDADEFIPLPG